MHSDCATYGDRILLKSEIVVENSFQGITNIYHKNQRAILSNRFAVLSASPRHMRSFMQIFKRQLERSRNLRVGLLQVDYTLPLSPALCSRRYQQR